MKAKKLFGILLAGVMALSTVAGLAACGGDDEDKDSGNNPQQGGQQGGEQGGQQGGEQGGQQGGEQGGQQGGEQGGQQGGEQGGQQGGEQGGEQGGGSEVTGPETVYTLVGVGSGEALWTNNWDPKTSATIEGLKFEGAFDEDGKTEIHTLTIDLYEGDEFQIIHDGDWAGQMGFSSVANAGKDANGKQCFVAAPGGGEIQNINIAAGQSGKYTLTLTKPASGAAVVSFEQVENYTELVLVKLVDMDGAAVGPSNSNFLARGRYYKKGATVSAIPYTPDEALTPPMMKFAGFNKVTEEGGKYTVDSKWEEGVCNENMTLQYFYEEDANPDFHPDKEGAEYTLVGTSTNQSSDLTTKPTELKFVKQSGYSYHNVYTISDVVLYSGDKIQISWGATDAEKSKFDWITNGRSFNQDGEAAVIPTDGYWSIRANVIANEDGSVKEMEISISRQGAVLSGYYLVGTCLEKDWGAPNGTDPELANSLGFFFTQSDTDANVWTVDINVTTSMIPSWSKNGTSAEMKVKLYQRDGEGADYGIGEGNGTAGSGNIVLEAGHTYTITFNSQSHVISWVVKA